VKLGILDRLDDVLRDLDDELIDQALTRGQPPEPEYDNCPHCGCDWHALRCRPDWWLPEHDQAEAEGKKLRGHSCRCDSAITPLDDTWRPLGAFAGERLLMHREGLDGYAARAVRSSRPWIELKVYPRLEAPPEPADWGPFLRFVNDLAIHNGPTSDMVNATIATYRDQWARQAVSLNGRGPNDTVTITMTNEAGISGDYTLQPGERVTTTYQPHHGQPTLYVSQKVWLYRPDGSVHRITHAGLVRYRGPGVWPPDSEDSS
jgi:hypothetical protein